MRARIGSQMHHTLNLCIPRAQSSPYSLAHLSLFAASKQSDMDIIFGEGNKTVTSGNGSKYTRSGGSISDADMIFGGPPSNYKSDRFGAAKSMSMSSSGATGYGYSSGSAVGSSSATNSYKIYEGIQNAAFSDYSETGSVSSINSGSKRWGAKPEEEDELDLK